MRRISGARSLGTPEQFSYFFCSDVNETCWYCPTFAVLRARNTQDSWACLDIVWVLVGTGTVNQHGSLVEHEPSWSIHDKRSICRRLVCEQSTCLKRPGILLQLHAICRDDHFPWKHFLNIVLLQAELTSLTVPTTSCKNPKVLEILQRIQQGSLAWARVYLFSCCRRDQGRVDSEGICFVFCYRHHEGFLQQMVRNEANLKQLRAHVSSQAACISAK